MSKELKKNSESFMQARHLQHPSKDHTAFGQATHVVPFGASIEITVLHDQNDSPLRGINSADFFLENPTCNAFHPRYGLRKVK